jgi:uncharacterized protein YjiS (DUF1127 family)
MAFISRKGPTLGPALFVLSVTSTSHGIGILQVNGRRRGAMTIIARKFSTLNFLRRRRRYTGADLDVLSDKCLKDIGFRLERRDLNSVKPFWLA